MSLAIVTDTSTRRGIPVMPPQTRDDLMHPLERQLTHARLSLAHVQPPVFSDHLAPEFLADVKYAARVAVNLLDKERLDDAILRARDELAHALYGTDYQFQKRRVQLRINKTVEHVWNPIRVHLQGISEPLPPSERTKLQPELRRPKAVQS